MCQNCVWRYGKKQSEENIIEIIRNLFKLKKENEEKLEILGPFLKKKMIIINQ